MSGARRQHWTGEQWGLRWHRDGSRYTLHHSQRKAPLLSVEPDAKWPCMWRVRKPDGSLTDMVNLTRAKEAALPIATAHLNLKHGEKATDASAVRSAPLPDVRQPSASSESLDALETA
jgi:hypothetical protein